MTTELSADCRLSVVSPSPSPKGLDKHRPLFDLPSTSFSGPYRVHCFAGHVRPPFITEVIPGCRFPTNFHIRSTSARCPLPPEGFGVTRVSHPFRAMTSRNAFAFFRRLETRMGFPPNQTFARLPRGCLRFGDFFLAPKGSSEIGWDCNDLTFVANHLVLKEPEVQIGRAHV